MKFMKLAFGEFYNFFYEMIRNVRLCLSYCSLKWDSIAFKVNVISTRKHIVDMDVFNDVTCAHQVLLYVWSYEFYDTILSTE